MSCLLLCHKGITENFEVINLSCIQSCMRLKVLAIMNRTGQHILPSEGEGKAIQSEDSHIKDLQSLSEFWAWFSVGNSFWFW